MHEGAKLPIPSRACCVNPSTQVDLYKAPEPLAKSIHLNQTTQKNTCQIILPKTFRNRTFQTQEYPSIILVTRPWKSGVFAPPGVT